MVQQVGMPESWFSAVRPSLFQVLEAINIVLAGSQFIVVAGMDKDVIRSAVKTTCIGGQPKADEVHAELFLQKIVHVSD